MGYAREDMKKVKVVMAAGIGWKNNGGGCRQGTGEENSQEHGREGKKNQRERSQEEGPRNPGTYAKLCWAWQAGRHNDT